MAKELFGRTLSRLRAEAGHKTAYSFFHKDGGRIAFGCSFRQYLNIEKGLYLPRPRVLSALARILHIALGGAKDRDLALAYLQTAGGPDFFRHFLAPLLSAALAERKHPLEAAIQKSRSARTHPLTPKQADLITKTPAHYWTLMALVNEQGRWPPAKIARLIGLPIKDVERALRDLSGKGLAQSDKKGLYYCPIKDPVFVYPRLETKPYLYPNDERLLSHEAGMMKQKGERLFRQSMTFRASESDLLNYFPYLYQALLGSEVYSTLEKKPDSALFVVETRVNKLFPF